MITTYNCPEALYLVFNTVAIQSRLPDEVVVCDDGSCLKTRNLVNDWSGRLPVRHVWQPDHLFRAAKARNLGIKKTYSEYLIWIDGDCLIPSDFIKNHLRLAQRGFLVAGGRHLLTASDTQSLLNESMSVSEVFKHWKFKSFPLGRMRDLQSASWKIVRTCNMATYRDELIGVKGFDESYVGWGREDSDLVLRLIHNGTRIRSGRFSACVAHLHHTESSDTKISSNEQRFRNALRNSDCIRPEQSMLADK